MNLVFSTMLASYPSFFFAPRRSGECMHLHVYSWAASWVTAILLRIWKICIDGPQKQKNAVRPVGKSDPPPSSPRPDVAKMT